MNGPQANWLQDGRRLHLNHGPIDLIEVPIRFLSVIAFPDSQV